MTIEIEYQLPGKPANFRTFYRWASANAFIKDLLKRFPGTRTVTYTD